MMNEGWQAVAQANVGAIALVLARVAALVFVAPVFGGQSVPAWIRAMLSVAIAGAVYPLTAGTIVAPALFSVQFAVALAAEAMLGAWLGLALLALFGGLRLAGQIIGRLGGETLAETLDPTTDEPSDALSQLLFWTALAVFFCAGGHRVVIAGLLDTFRVLPPGGVGLPDAIGETCALLISQSFSLAIRVAAPAAAALLISAIAVGIIGRTIPQLNGLSFGANVNSLVMFVVVLVALGGMAWAMEDPFRSMFETTINQLR